VPDQTCAVRAAELIGGSLIAGQAGLFVWIVFLTSSGEPPASRLPYRLSTRRIPGYRAPQQKNIRIPG